MTEIPWAIGAPNSVTNGVESGHVRVYRYASGVWGQLGATIYGKTNITYAYFGRSVSLSEDGNTVAIGAPDLLPSLPPYLSPEKDTTDRGLVRVYRYASGVWGQLGADINGGAGGGDQFGWSVSLSNDGTTVAIGATYATTVDFFSGKVKVYRYAGGAWGQLGTDINSEASGDQSGHSVSLSEDGNTVAIGAPLNNGNGADSGHVRVYRYASGTWGQLGTDIDGESTGDNSGNAVSLSNDGNTVAIGAPYNDGNGTDSGHVRVYRFIATSDSTTSSGTICFTSGTPITTDQGIVSVESINPKIHTINKRKIIGITKIRSVDDYLVCFEKNAIDKNIPSQRTIMSKDHGILYEGKMIRAQHFTKRFKNVHKIPYTGEILYNVLLESHYKITVNNMICETLHPSNSVAKLYIESYKKSLVGNKNNKKRKVI